MLVIAIVMIVVVGPKDLPQMLRTFGRMMAKMRGMANDFQKQFNEALKEAELEDVKKSVDALRGLNPAAEIRKQLNPFEKAAADVRAGLDNAMKPKPAETPTSTEAPAPALAEAQPAEPVKNGVDVPGGPDALPTPPTFPPMTDASVTAPASASAEAAKQAPKVTKPATAKAATAKLSPAKTSSTKTSAKSSSPAAAKSSSSPRPLLAKAARPAPGKVAAASKTSAKVATKPAKPATKSSRAPK
jgi:sec-independent protein translocase protein TatB